MILMSWSGFVRILLESMFKKKIIYTIHMLFNHDTWKKYWKWFLVYSIINLILLLIIWPGNFRHDDIIVANMARDYDLVPWQHFLTSYFYIASMKILPFPTGVIIIQVLAISAIVAYLLMVARKKLKITKPWQEWVLLLPFLLPPVLMNNLYPLRTTLCAYLFILLLVKCMLIVTNNKKIKLGESIWLIILFIIVGSWRSENIIVILPLIIVLFVCIRQKRIKWQYGILSFVIIAAGILGITKYNDSLMGGNAANNYKLTAIMEALVPLIRTEITHHGMESEDVKTIGRVVNIDMVAKNWDMSGISLYWEGVVYPNYTEEEYTDLMKTYIKLILRYPSTFIKQRIKEFYLTTAMPGSDEEYNILMDSASGFEKLEDGSPYKELVDLSGDIERPIDSKIRKYVMYTLEGSSPRGDGGKTIIYYTFYNISIPILFILVAIIYLFKKRKVAIALILCSLLVQAMAVFMTAPDHLFMYYFPQYIGGYLCFAILLLYNYTKERRRK